MAYYRRAHGIEGYKLAKASKPENCSVCLEEVKEGQQRYKKLKFILCILCKEEWYAMGKRLIDISRYKAR